ncbi:MAG: branched-chain amino acid ABC transporter permease [Deinococcales bacterium]
MILKQRYEQDLRLVSSLQGWVSLVVVIALLLLLPQFFPAYAYPVALFMIYGITAIGLNILVGFTGQISLGHAGFFAIGAYIIAKFAPAITFPFALLLAIGICATLGYLVGIPALRLEGPYLAIATSGFGLAVQQFFGNSPKAWFGGQDGLIVEKSVLFGDLFARDRSFYYIVLLLCAFLVFMAFNLARSHIGRAFVAVRDAELAAQTSGVNVAKQKTLAFAISAVYAGVGGALFAPLLGIVAPESFGLLFSVQLLSMIVIGGIGTVAGGILGAGLITALQDQLAQAGNWAGLLYGLVVLLVMTLEPLGLYGRWLKIKAYWKSWPL